MLNIFFQQILFSWEKNEKPRRCAWAQEKIEKSTRNIPNVKVTDVNHFSAYDIIKFKKIVFTESSIKELFVWSLLTKQHFYFGPVQTQLDREC